MRQGFDQTAVAGGNYYHEFLQYLFYEALAQDRKDQPDPNYYPRFACKIPFLNGGLFEAEYDWQGQVIDLPDSLFHNDEKNKAGDEGTGILNVFDRYNFTIKEDEPLEKEVAVDPEMLGKVFENMLDDKERKSKGAFYTPREIVYYMCQLSLIHYLDNGLNSLDEKDGQLDLLAVGQGDAVRVPKDDIETLIRKGHLFVENDDVALQAMLRIESGEQKKTKHKVELPQSVKVNAKLIDDKLADIKVCDPAIGSGAFPVGLLHEIVTARLALAPHSGNQRSSYDLKRHTIRESLYGVDIDPSAIDIARLRLWLSLIVDEDDFSSIEALPNLDYKIMQGNSLVEEYWGVKLFNEDFIKEDDGSEAKIQRLKERKRAIDSEGFALHGANQLTADRKKWIEQETKKILKAIKALRSAPKEEQQGLFDTRSEAKKKASQLERLHKDFFSAFSAQKKKEIRQQITTLEWELIEATLVEQKQLEFLGKLQQIKQSGEKPFFLWKLNFPEVFKEKGGFDVVIGNPPYVRADGSEEHSALRKAILSSNQYETLWEKWDLYIPFIEKGYKLLREGGVTTMIVSDAYCHAKYAKKSQEWFLKNSRVLRLDFFSKIQLFDAGVRNITYFFQKADGARHRPERRVHAPAFGSVTCLATDEQRKLDCRAFFPEESSLKSKYNNVIPISKICYISFGCRPNSDEKKARGLFKVKDLLSTIKDATHPKPYIEAKDIERWIYNQNRWLEWETDRSPSLLARATFEELYEVVEKIVVADVSGAINRAAYDSAQVYHSHTLISVVPWHSLAGIINSSIKKSARYQSEKTTGIDLPNREDLEELSRNFTVKYLLAVMNSTVAHEFLHTHRRSNIHLYPDDWKQVPIPNIPKESQKTFHILVDYILAIYVGPRHAVPLQSAYFEELIDGLVYELYFPAELKTANKEILDHLGELTLITDTMSDEEKLAVIQTEFDRLYDPRHPVRNHLETLDSVEVVRIIREALKR
ncbi:MAG: hypothetical protein A2511_01975 [Deltaproteobacteria bacterium RIFOXYD12_FULL_50_9]|nr:MAG: hypothetical protein A2511_01975 [Deltaproteobacteria bacterium RIFOXYD12_FULL_50_9]